MEKKEIFEFTGEEVRLDVFLAENLTDYSRNFVKDLIKNGHVSVDGKVERPSFVLKLGASVEVAWPKLKKPKESVLAKMIVYEDDQIIMINKPAGLMVHPVKAGWETNLTVLFSAEETLVKFIAAAYPELEESTERFGLVHRLDRETSGIMIVAKTLKAQENILEQFQSRKVGKLYNAICIGELKHGQGIIDVPIGRVAGGKIKASSVGRSALTEYKLVESKNDLSFVELFPKTGRTNQLRVHMAWLGNPVLGDYVYGNKPAPRLMLHARKVEFKHPGTKKKISFEAPLPKDFSDILKKEKFSKAK